MTHEQIHGNIKPDTTIYSVSFGMLLEYKFKLTEVHTNYDGSRTYYSVLTDKSGVTWCDHSTNEWFTTKEEALKWGIEREKKIIAEHTNNLNKYTKMQK